MSGYFYRPVGKPRRHTNRATTSKQNKALNHAQTIERQPADVNIGGMSLPEYAVSKPAPGVVAVRLAGPGVMALGMAPLRDLTRRVEHSDRVEIFIDATALEGSSVEQSDAWALWLARHRARLKQVNLLPSTGYVQVSADFLRRFADTNGLLRIYVDRDAYEAAFSAAVLQARRRVIAIIDWMGGAQRSARVS